tara:strand:+ start:931 stop:1215 length:285 start_codon:yes stop_codon:yes gene_type:complete
MFHPLPRVLLIKVSKLSPGSKLRFTRRIIKAALEVANAVTSKQAIDQYSHIPEETVGKENIPAPMADPIHITVPENAVLGEFESCVFGMLYLCP